MRRRTLLILPLVAVLSAVAAHAAPAAQRLHCTVAPFAFDLPPVSFARVTRPAWTGIVLVVVGQTTINCPGHSPQAVAIEQRLEVMFPPEGGAVSGRATESISFNFDTLVARGRVVGDWDGTLPVEVLAAGPGGTRLELDELITIGAGGPSSVVVHSGFFDVFPVLEG
jgi:hypothetical protein